MDGRGGVCGLQKHSRSLVHQRREIQEAFLHPPPLEPHIKNVLWC